MRLSRPTLVALLLLALTAAPVAAAPPARADAARAEHERIVRFWTPERMAAAKPRDFVRTPSGFQPANKGKPGGGGGSTTVTGASWTGGTVSDAVGKVFFTMGSSTYQCSGSVAKDSRPSYSLVLTAAHCAYDERARAFATNWMFIPAWGSSPTSYKVSCADYTTTKYGCWTAAALVVHHGYASAGGFNVQAIRHDFAFAVVGLGGKSNSELDAIPAMGRGFPLVSNYGSITKGTQMYAFGYPAAGTYNGNTLTYCAGNIVEDRWTSNTTWGMNCDMTGGSSGGPWMASFDPSAGSGTLGSVNSYRYRGDKNMYGPKFNSDTGAVYSAAQTATGNTTVGEPAP
jgi:hypothetical protein